MAFAMDRQGAHAHTFPNTRLLDEAELLSAVQVLCLWHVLFLHGSRSVETYKCEYATTLPAHVHSAVACHEIRLASIHHALTPI